MPFGEKVWEKVIQVEEFVPQEELLTSIDLTPALSHPDIGVGQVGIVVLPTKKAQYPRVLSYVTCLFSFTVISYPNSWTSSEVPVIRAWVQCTRLGLDVISDSNKVTAWVTDLVNSVPVDKVQLSCYKAVTKVSTTLFSLNIGYVNNNIIFIKYCL